ncbi:MAG: glycosyltransferase [Clostridia bacterium]|nr:glycosyltransferase [Clostridia bacterium]
MKTLYVLLPCYNEAENIGNLIEEWEKQEEKLEQGNLKLQIRVINDASTDNTREVVLEKCKNYSNIQIVEHEVNKGLCGGINTAVNYFHNNAQSGDLLAIMDGDNTQNPKYIHSMIEKIQNGNDCVIASRYQEGAAVKGLAKYREKLSDIAGIYYKVVLNIDRVKDYTCGYRIYTYEIIEKLINKFGQEVVKEKSFACMMELLYKVNKVGAKFDEVPFELRYDNKKGTSKMRVFTTMRRSIVTAIKLQLIYNTKTVIANSLICLFLVALPLFLSLITNYSPINNQDILHDCGIFSYIGYAMQNGVFMYTGAWDNKGPLLYFIYYIGLKFDGEFGVYFLEYLSLLITTIFGYKTIKVLSKNKLLSVIGCFYALCTWVPTNERGTLSENFALPFLMIGIYLFVKTMLNDTQLSKGGIILLGICSAALAMLRLNILLIFLPLFLLIGIRLIINRRFKEIGKWIIYGIIGFLTLCVPMAIYLFMNNALIECINTAYLQVLGGFNTGDRLKAVQDMLEIFNKDTYAGILMAVFVIVSLVLLIFKKIKEKNIKYLIIGSILAILINLYSNSLSGAVQMHYFITFIPIIFIVVAIIIYAISIIRNRSIRRVAEIAVVIAMIIIGIYNYGILENQIIDRRTPIEDDIRYSIRGYIEKHSNPEDTVQLIGGGSEAVSANYKTKRLAPTKYSYLPLWDSFTLERRKEIIDEFVESVIIEKPKLIIVCDKDYQLFESLVKDKEKWNNFLNEKYEKKDNFVNDYTAYELLNF